MTLDFSYPLTELSTKNLPGGERQSDLKADKLTNISESSFWKIWDPRRLKILWNYTVY
jgi:hypothetical protein